MVEQIDAPGRVAAGDVDEIARGAMAQVDAVLAAGTITKEEAAEQRSLIRQQCGDRLLAKALATALAHTRIPLANEKQTQAALGDLFTAMGLFHAREFRLGNGCIVDFWAQGANGKGMAIEVKMRGAARRHVLDQLERYAAQDMVTAIILISNKAIDLPTRINGKPVYFISLGRAWL